MNTDTPAPFQDDEDVLICEYEQRPRGAPSFIDVQDAITAVAREGGSLRVAFDPARRTTVEQLVEAERRCCPTIGFEVSAPPDLTLTIRATPGKLATLEQMLTTTAAQLSLRGVGAIPDNLSGVDYAATAKR